jgi:hypothetical protein
MENITFFVERYGVIAVFLNVLLEVCRCLLTSVGLERRRPVRSLYWCLWPPYALRSSPIILDIG